VYTRRHPYEGPGTRPRSWSQKLDQAITTAAYPVTVSLGVVDADQEDLPTVLARADAALYTAKDEGRDRVVVRASHGQRSSASPDAGSMAGAPPDRDTSGCESQTAASDSPGRPARSRRFGALTETAGADIGLLPQPGGWQVDGFTVGAWRARRSGCRRWRAPLKIVAAAAAAFAVVVLAGGPVLADGGAPGAGDGGNGQSGDGGGAAGVRGVLQCVSPHVGADGHTTSYTAVWGFAGVPNASYRVPDGWRNDVSGGTGKPPVSVDGDGDPHGVAGTWTSDFSGGTAVWHLGDQTIEADSTSTPCSPAPQVPEVAAAVVAPLVVMAGLGVGLLVRRRRRLVS
jgi:hypothetical protein